LYRREQNYEDRPSEGSREAREPDTLKRMFRRAFPLAALALAVGLVSPSPAHAQLIFESIGMRALGMAGAFVAVADDATATYWNPAGLPSGGPAGMTLEWNRFQTGNQKAPPTPGPSLGTATFTSLGTWPVGVSYGRFQTSWLAPGTPGQPAGEYLQVFQLGGTIVQTVAPGVVVGSTLKYLHGTFVTAPSGGPTVGDALNQTRDLEGDGHAKFDLDVGVMADMKMVRLGLTSRNLTDPHFADVAGNVIALGRQTRAGVAVLPTSGLTLAMDVDLNTVDLRDGLRRMIALGGESRLGSHVALRGGYRWNLEGNHQQAGAVGLSVGLRSHAWVDGYYTIGRRDEDRGFGIGLRAGY
jgi:hypothetical protein